MLVPKKGVTMGPIIMMIAAAAGVQSSDGTCRRTHIFADGRVETSVIADDGQGASAASSSSHGAHASSHVSASSSSAGGSRASSSASSSSDGSGRSMTVARGPEGCRIIIDERPERNE
ncbi:hypothetical protein [Sphingobium agri]|uniref:Uncharacterized protein n=2 Tax=Sphingobium TaxID=165695 RepID=A0ABT0E0I1_9SPHN|nr:hypothetical protein [Sphingobium agri]MCK0532868.1 hypothetical protein [Sphingobium agri]